MKAPDVIYTESACISKDKIYFETAPNKHKDITYIRLDKVKELIEAERQVWIEQQKDSEIDLNIVALDVVEGQLEGLE